jgi:hypothetical protein
LFLVQYGSKTWSPNLTGDQSFFDDVHYIQAYTNVPPYQGQEKTLLWFVTTWDIPEKFLTMKAADSSKTLANTGQNNWCPNTGALSLNLYNHEYAKNHMKFGQLTKKVHSSLCISHP